LKIVFDGCLDPFDKDDTAGYITRRMKKLGIHIKKSFCPTFINTVDIDQRLENNQDLVVGSISYFDALPVGSLNINDGKVRLYFHVESCPKTETGWSCFKTTPFDNISNPSSACPSDESWTSAEQGYKGMCYDNDGDLQKSNSGTDIPWPIKTVDINVENSDRHPVITGIKASRTYNAADSTNYVRDLPDPNNDSDNHIYVRINAKDPDNLIEDSSLTSYPGSTDIKQSGSFASNGPKFEGSELITCLFNDDGLIPFTDARTGLAIHGNLTPNLYPGNAEIPAVEASSGYLIDRSFKVDVKTQWNGKGVRSRDFPQKEEYLYAVSCSVPTGFNYHTGSLSNNIICKTIGFDINSPSSISPIFPIQCTSPQKVTIDIKHRDRPPKFNGGTVNETISRGPVEEGEYAIADYDFSFQDDDGDLLTLDYDGLSNDGLPAEKELKEPKLSPISSISFRLHYELDFLRVYASRKVPVGNLSTRNIQLCYTDPASPAADDIASGAVFMTDRVRCYNGDKRRINISVQNTDRPPRIISIGSNVDGIKSCRLQSGSESGLGLGEGSYYFSNRDSNEWMGVDYRASEGKGDGLPLYRGAPPGNVAFDPNFHKWSCTSTPILSYLSDADSWLTQTQADPPTSLSKIYISEAAWAEYWKSHDNNNLNPRFELKIAVEDEDPEDADDIEVIYSGPSQLQTSVAGFANPSANLDTTTVKDPSSQESPYLFKWGFNWPRGEIPYGPFTKDAAYNLIYGEDRDDVIALNAPFTAQYKSAPFVENSTKIVKGIRIADSDNISFPLSNDEANIYAEAGGDLLQYILCGDASWLWEIRGELNMHTSYWFVDLDGDRLDDVEISWGEAHKVRKCVKVCLLGECWKTWYGLYQGCEQPFKARVRSNNAWGYWKNFRGVNGDINGDGC
jgi:hypothetical protein